MSCCGQVSGRRRASFKVKTFTTKDTKGFGSKSQEPICGMPPAKAVLFFGNATIVVTGEKKACRTALGLDGRGRPSLHWLWQQFMKVVALPSQARDKVKSAQ